MRLPIGVSTDKRVIDERSGRWVVVSCILQEELPQEQDDIVPRAEEDWQQWKWDKCVDGGDGSVQRSQL